MSGTQNGQLSTDPFHVYYNISIQNDDTSGDNPPPILKFDEIRNGTILQNPSDYFLSVVRFSVDTPTLPIFIPERRNTAGNVNELIYSVTYEWNGVRYQQFVTYVPQSPWIAPPLAAPAPQDTQGTYYYIYQPEPFFAMVNRALADGWAAFLALAGAPAGLAVGNPPQFVFTKTNNFATLFVPRNYFLQSNAGIPTQAYLNATLDAGLAIAGNRVPVSLYFNSPMYELVSSLSAYNTGFLNVTPDVASLGRNYLIQFYDTYTGNATSVSNATTAVNYIPPVYTPQYVNAVAPVQLTYISAQQQYATIALWNPVCSVVFTTAGFPVNPEQVSAPVVYGNTGRNLTNSGNNANIANVLTDFEVALDQGDEYKPTIHYTPSAEYRLIDLQSNAPLNNLQISVYWKDPTGTLHPFRLSAGATATIKVMFRKKTFNTGY